MILLWPVNNTHLRLLLLPEGITDASTMNRSAPDNKLKQGQEPLNYQPQLNQKNSSNRPTKAIFTLAEPQPGVPLIFMNYQKNLPCANQHLYGLDFFHIKYDFN